MIKDPWRVFLTTDHPNGAPFTTYTELIRLLMDSDFRNSEIDKISSLDILELNNKYFSKPFLSVSSNENLCLEIINRCGKNF